MKSNALAYVATVLALLGILWTAAEQWGDIKARVAELERADHFYHGETPKEIK